MLRLRTAVRNTDPGYFALVMATCIVSRGMQLDGAARLSGILLAAGITAYVVLAAVYAARLAAYRADVRADAADPRRAFGFFSLTAGSDVLAARLAADAHMAAAAVLLVIGGASWVLLSYGLPLLLAFPVRLAELAPGYWVFMGASAISVLAGAQIMRLPSSPLLTAAHAVVAGLSVMLWAFGTWLIPFLVILGGWRHGLRRVPLAYEPGWWSIVFPVGMYGVASHELGAALHVSWLVTLGRDEAWAALAVWAAVMLAMAGTLRPGSKRRPSRSSAGLRSQRHL